MNRMSYTISYYILNPFVRLLWPFRTYGKENKPAGAALVCANHQSNLDPALLAAAFGTKTQMRFMGKKDLFTVPVLGKWMLEMGAFPIDRNEADITAIRTAMKYLKAGEYVMMFPEGTRVSPEDSVAAKTGAVRIAGKLQVPILPVYIESTHKVFHFSRLYIGEPYTPEAAHTKDDYARLSQELMDKIHALEPKK